ncbi:MAG: pyridoxamine 5'-phosphate oxidase family protein [Anaerolineae bacterium]|nr:pyridoxamine 5'-phosphate oxidase family protein [Anaerolineae bacterium]
MKLPDDVRAFLAAHNTLTLATVNDDGTPHACDLFYAQVGTTFYFLSDPQTRHVHNLTREPRVAVTIHGDARGWQEIRGVQIIGIAARVTRRTERARAFAAYIRKYAFVRAMLPRVEMLGRAHPTFGVVELYKIVPRWVRWIDNTRRFGYKYVIQA